MLGTQHRESVVTFDEQIQRAISVYVFTIQTESSKYAAIPEDDLRERRHDAQS